MGMSFIVNLDLKKICLLFLIISAALISTSFAGRVSKSMDPSKDIIMSSGDEVLESWEQIRHDDKMSEIHERLLKVKTNDYGRYDPAPAFVKPPFKLIPN